MVLRWSSSVEFWLLGGGRWLGGGHGIGRLVWAVALDIWRVGVGRGLWCRRAVSEKRFGDGGGSFGEVMAALAWMELMLWGVAATPSSLQDPFWRSLGCHSWSFGRSFGTRRRGCFGGFSDISRFD